MNALKRYSVLSRIICLVLLFFVSFNTAQNSFGAVEEGNCDDINELVGYGIIGETSFVYGQNSEINTNTITDLGNTPTPDGNCETIDLDFPPIDPEIFPATEETGQTDLTPSNNPVLPGEYGTLDFKAEGNDSTFIFDGGNYYIKELIAPNKAIVQLAPGNYFIEKISLGNTSEIMISPSGQVNLYIKTSFLAGNDFKLNSSGDTGDFIIYLYNPATLEIGAANQGSTDADFNGIIYSPGASSIINFNNDNNITGAILSAGTVVVGNNTEFDYDADVQSEVLDALGCEVPGPDHIRIEHTGSGLTCQRSDVVLRACVDADCTSELADPISLSMTPASSNPPTWIGGDSYTFTGNQTIQLRQTVSGTVTLGLTNANPAPTNGYRCYDSGVEGDCDIEFYDAGFLVSVPDLTSCQSSAVPFIQAVRKDDETESCIADGGFANQTKTVGFWVDYLQPDTGSKVPRLNGTSLTTASPGTDVSLIFDNDARTTFELTYDDAGQLQLNALYQGSGEEEGLVMTGNDSFVVVPHSLRVQPTSDGTIPLDNTSFSGTPHWPAGEDFSVEVAGVCSDGTTVTPNFAADVTLSAVGPYLPAAGVLGTLNGGSLITADFSAGVARDDSVYYTEVGTVTILAETEDYLDSGIDVSGSSAPVGRFTPAEFALSWYQSPVLMPACSLGDFTYLGQSFGYFAAPVIKVTAQNMQDNVTANYTQTGWWKITAEAALLSGRSYSAAEGVFELSGAEVSYAFPVDGAGSGTLTFDQGSAMKFVRGAPVGPFYAAIDLQINVEDADLISASAPLSISDIPFVGEDKVNGINTDEMRWGRLVLQNAYGSELVPLAMPLRAEYFNGSSFVFNSGDGCTSVALTQLSLTNGVDTFTADNDIPVGGGATTASLVNPLDAGDAHLSFTPPGDEGYVDVTADLSLLDWLRYDWDGDGTHDDNPLGRATFGIYKGQPNLIYMRETFR